MYNTVSNPAHGSPRRPKELAKMVREIAVAIVNEDKYKVLHIGKRNPEESYQMQGQELQSVKAEKDLEVTIYCQLTFHLTYFLNPVVIVYLI